MVGEGATLLVRRALTAARLVEPPDAVSRFLAFYDARLLNYTRPYPGVIDVVHLAREYARVAVLTNKPKPPTEPDFSMAWASATCSTRSSAETVRCRASPILPGCWR